jgi:hypothetical protein
MFSEFTAGLFSRFRYISALSKEEFCACRLVLHAMISSLLCTQYATLLVVKKFVTNLAEFCREAAETSCLGVAKVLLGKI